MLNAPLMAITAEVTALEEYAARLRRENALLRAKVATLFDEIKHGDEAHQQWLKDKIEAQFKGI